ncbi:unnamed protein product [Closterium sp. NIES-54]
MASRVLVSGLPRSLPPLPPGPAPTCVPCVEGRQRAAPHSSEFPPTEAPLQTLHMDVWGPARVRGQGHERYFLLVVDDYSRYTTVFPLHSKGEVTEVLIDWIRVARHQLRERFDSDFPVLRLHSDRGGEFSSDLLRAFCRAEGIRQTFTLPASPQQNGIAERRIGMVMDVARTSMIHAAAPHFLWLFAVQYAAHQINLQPRVSLPETSPTLRWTGKVGDASAFCVWGSRAFVRDFSADKLSSRAVPCTFSPTPKMTTLRVLLHVAAQRDYELHSLDFSTAFLQGSLHEEIWLRRPPGFIGSFPPGTQWSLRRPVYGLRQAPREWHDTLRTTLATLGFAPSTADPSLFLRTDTLVPPFYILVYVDDLVFATADTAGLAHVKSELQKRHTCTDLGELRSYLGLHITRDRARRTITLTQSHMVQQVLQRFDCTYSLPQATPLSTRHSLSALPSDESVEPSGPYPELVGCLISSCEAEIYAVAMAAQELCWFTYLLTDLGEPPHSPSVLYVDNKAMLALCREHRLEHRTKHIALRYFLARELQQRGQLRLAYVACQANTADIFTKALQPCDHQRFCTMLGLFIHSCSILHTDATTAAAAPIPIAAMASPTVLTFDSEGRAVDFDVWVDDLQLFLQCDSRDGVSLFDHTSSVSTAPTATADSTVRSHWTTRDAVARLAVRSHLPPTERAHFGQYKTAQSLYDAVVAHYSSPATAALSRLMLPYLFPDLAAFATVADLVAHLRTSDACYHAALLTEFCAKNPPPHVHHHLLLSHPPP